MNAKARDESTRTYIDKHLLKPLCWLCPSPPPPTRPLFGRCPYRKMENQTDGIFNMAYYLCGISARQWPIIQCSGNAIKVTRCASNQFLKGPRPVGSTPSQFYGSQIFCCVLVQSPAGGRSAHDVSKQRWKHGTCIDNVCSAG